VRITNDTKNGTSSMSRKKLFFSTRNAIQYANGKLTIRSITVAAPAYHSDRSRIEWVVPSSSLNSPKCHVILQASVNESQVCSDRDIIVSSGTRKKITSQKTAGAPRKYGLSRFPRRPR